MICQTVFGGDTTDFKIPDYVRFCLKTLEGAGFCAYLVGGCVRDMLMGREPHDYDIACSAPPEQIRPLFEKTVDTGLRHGTVTVVLDGGAIEVTQMRVDGAYTDHRRPDCVTPANNIEEDLRRRDFTVNAIAADAQGNLTDICGGAEDIRRRVIRAVGDARLRFSEDALRILRAFRFCSQLEFDIDRETLEAAIASADLVENVSAERIYSELERLLCGARPWVVQTLISCGALKKAELFHIQSAYLLGKVENRPQIRLAALILLCGADPKRVTAALKCSAALSRSVVSLCELYAEFDPTIDKPRLKSLADRFGFALLRDLIALKSGLTDQNFEQVLLALSQCENEPVFIRQLAIGGDDLLALGIRGADIGKTLKKLQKAVWEYPELNEKNKLNYVAKNMKP